MNTKRDFKIYRSYKLIATAVFSLCVLLLSSCEKYLDIKRTSTQSFIESANDCQLLLNDYEHMNKGFPSDGELSAGDFYVNDAGYLAGTVSAEDRSFYTWQTTAIRASSNPQYVNSYQTIYRSNLVLEALDKISDGSKQSMLDDIRGQALFFRAYCFWQIAQLYAQPYLESTANQYPGIPIRLTSDINEKYPRGTVKQTYDQIISDLNKATEILSDKSDISSRPCKAAAYAMLARVYLSMQNYPQALLNATLSLQINNQLMDYNTATSPFPRFNKEVLFQSLTTSATLLTPGSATSNIAKIDLSLVSSYSDNDLRKTLFFKANSGSHVGTFRFTGNYEPVTTSTLFNGLAVDEIYLIRAECYARSGNIALSMADLNTLLRTRYKSGTFTNIVAATADEALANILTERRKELIMRGQRWTDLRRLNMDPRFRITLTRTVQGNIFTIAPNELKYTLLLPQDVITNTDFTQNQR
jgi:hypothetical protein